MEVRKGIRAAQWGVLVNVLLAIVKLIAGVLGNSYALIADAVESAADVFGSLIVWGGLQIAGREPDDEYPFGYGKAESLAAAVVALLIIGAGFGIAVQAIREILTPHFTPAPWTLAVLVGVIVIKSVLSRHVRTVGRKIGSHAVRADAWHHLSDAITSAAAFAGISIAIWGGRGWEAADDWAALAASLVVIYNGLLLLRPALNDLMDRAADQELVAAVRRAAECVPGVMAVEKLAVRKTGLGYQVVIHVHADPRMPLIEAHALGGQVKNAIRTTMPQVQLVIVHMEPFEQSEVVQSARL